MKVVLTWHYLHSQFFCRQFFSKLERRNDVHPVWGTNPWDRARTKHQELRSLIFAISGWVLLRTYVFWKVRPCVHNYSGNPDHNMFVIANKVFIFQLDFWTYPSEPGKSVDIHVPHNRMRQFKHALKRKSISFRIKIRNLQRVINKAGMRPRAVPFNGKFHSYSQVCLRGIVTEM